MFKLMDKKIFTNFSSISCLSGPMADIELVFMFISLIIRSTVK